MSIARKARRAGGLKAQPKTEMVFVPGGEFTMGSDRHYAEENPTHRVKVDGFFIDTTPVTNAEFARFVKETGHVTFAEIAPDPKDYPGALPHMLRAGSLVFVKSQGPVDLTNWSNWWTFGFGADWRHPYGRGSTIKGLDDIPSCTSPIAMRRLTRDGLAKSCPARPNGNSPRAAGSTAQSSPGAMFSSRTGSRWRTPGRASFPGRTCSRTATRAPRRCVPPNGYGLYDMIGNVWEWTTDWYASTHAQQKSCCMPVNPRGPREEKSYDPCQPKIKIPRKVIKGGSHLCAPNYCRRYRPAARHAEPIDTSTCHLGLRCIRREG
jgi:formylglycine-generating enzyme